MLSHKLCCFVKYFNCLFLSSPRCRREWNVSKSSKIISLVVHVSQVFRFSGLCSSFTFPPFIFYLTSFLQHSRREKHSVIQNAGKQLSTSYTARARSIEACRRAPPRRQTHERTILLYCAEDTTGYRTKWSAVLRCFPLRGFDEHCTTRDYNSWVAGRKPTSTFRIRPNVMFCARVRRVLP